MGLINLYLIPIFLAIGMNPVLKIVDFRTKKKEE